MFHTVKNSNLMQCINIYLIPKAISLILKPLWVCMAGWLRSHASKVRAFSFTIKVKEPMDDLNLKTQNFISKRKEDMIGSPIAISYRSHLPMPNCKLF